MPVQIQKDSRQIRVTGRLNESGADARPALSTLLSQVLVAFTIEADNEFERAMTVRMSPSDSDTESVRRPWTTSLVMWANLMRYVTESGVATQELQNLAGVTEYAAHICLAGMERWGYVDVTPGASDSPSKRPRLGALVRPTQAGRIAREVWEPLLAEIEQRWQSRFGAEEIAALRQSLEKLTGKLNLDLPEFIPVLRHGWFAEIPEQMASVPDPRNRRTCSNHDLAALLSRALLAFALEFERESALSLAMTANIVRVIGEEGALVRDIPRLSGVSKEAVSMAAGFLVRNGFAALESGPSGAGAKLVRLTRKGSEARNKYRRLLDDIENRWSEQCGEDNVRSLRKSLEAIVLPTEGGTSRLSEGLAPPPGSWRARRPYLTQTSAMIRDPGGSLPHYPLPLHRGGYPDGS